MIYTKNKLKERVLSLALCLSMVLTLLPVSVFAETETSGVACDVTDCAGTYNDDGFCTACDTHYQPATRNDDGVYEIKNAGQLYWFADKVNGGDTKINGKLTKDITVNESVFTNGALSSNTDSFRQWVPIGKNNNSYTGSFDGNGHTVSGLYYSGGSDYMGLFGCIKDGATIKNVGLIDSCFSVSALSDSSSDNVYLGGIVGYASASSSAVTVSGCYSTASLFASSSGSYVGGVVAYTAAMSDGKISITSCYNTGNVNAYSSAYASCYAGGVVAYIYSSSTTELASCYSTGNVNAYSSSAYSSSYAGGIVGCAYSNASDGVLINDCCCTTDTTCGKTYNYVTCKNVSTKSADAFKSGEAAYILNGGVTDGTQAYYQTLGTDNSPNFTGGTVYSYTNCEDSTAYANTKNQDGSHSYDGSSSTCAACESLIEASFDSSAEIYYGSIEEVFAKAEKSDGTLTLLVDQELGLSEPSTREITEKITLDLNGHTFKDSFNITLGSLTLKDTDSSGTGTLKGSVAVNVPDGIAAGAVKDSFTMQSGHITGNSADYAVKVTNGKFTMTGGDIKNNTAGGVFIGASGSFTVGNGATVKDNTKNGSAHNVYLSSGKTIELPTTYGFTGTMSVTTQTAPTTEAPVTIAIYYISSLSSGGNILSDNDAYTVAFSGESVTLNAPASSTPSEPGTVHDDSHPVCCDTSCAELEHLLPAGESWSSVNGTSSFTSGSWYLSENKDSLTMKPQTLGATVIRLCLNGHEVSNVQVDSNANLTVTDCQSGGSIGTLTVASGGSVTIYGGSFGKINVADSGKRVYNILGSGLAFYDENDKIVTDITKLENVRVGELLDCKHESVIGDTCAACGYENTVTVPTKNDEGYYEIYTASQLYWLGENLNSCKITRNTNAKLMANITVNENVLINGELNTEKADSFRTWEPILCESSSTTIGYTGTFDGNGKTISGLYYSNSATEYVGLFGFVKGGTVKDLTIADSYFCGENCVGAVAGYYGLNNYKPITIENCSSSAAVVGAKGVGGIVGKGFAKVTIKNCHNSGAVSGTDQIGGVVGNGNGSTIIGCSNSGSVTGISTESGKWIGGVTGDNGGSITGCYNTGTVTGKNSNDKVGGVVGFNNTGSVTNCYSTGSVIGGDKGNIGGIVGYISSGSITNSYSTGNVTGGTDSAIGGVVGFNNSGSVTNCYYLSSGAESGIGSGSGEAYAKDNFATGEVTYLLNNKVTDGTQAWYQTVGEGLPAFSGETVYYGYLSCNDEAKFSNTELYATKPHDFDNGFCTICGDYEPAVLNGDGVYEIKNAGQLYWFAQKVNGGETGINGNLTANITVNPGSFDASGNYTAVADETVRDWIPIGTSEHPFIGSFKSLGGYTISGLYFNNSAADNVGLFGCVGNGAKINTKINDEGAAEANGSIKLENSYIHAHNNVGAIVGGTVDGEGGNAIDVKIFQCNIKENVTIVGNENVGGIIGYSYADNIGRSSNYAAISGADNIGGVVGRNIKGTVTDCAVSDPATVSGTGNYIGGIAGYSTGRIESSSVDYTKVSGSQYVGGIAGGNSGTVTNCAVYGTISGECFVGGAVGHNTGTVQKISSMTGVTATGTTAANGTISFAGGIVGYNGGGTVEDCKSIRAVTGSGTQYVGGIVGYNDNNAVLKNSYSTCAVSGDFYAGAVLGFNQSGTVTNCYYTDYYGVMDGSGTSQCGIGAEKGKTSADVNGTTEVKSLDQFESGEVTYLLNGGKTDGTQVWYQTVGTVNLDFSGETVYGGYTNCSEKKSVVYSNTASDVLYTDRPEHGTLSYTDNMDGTHTPCCSVCGDTFTAVDCTYENGKCTLCRHECAHPSVGADGFCTVCGMSTAEPKQENGVYLISSVAELYWFAQYVNKGNTDAAAKLTEDIAVNPGTFNADGTYKAVNGETPRKWVPISCYTQSFDGQGYTVSGLYCDLENYTYVGFFGQTAYNYELKNLHIANSYFAGKYAGAIVGYGETYLSNCSVSADVYINGSIYSGGLLGYAYGGSIDNCYSLAKVGEKGTWGGLVGENCVSIKNCFTDAMQPVGHINSSYGGSLSNVYYAEDTRDYTTPDSEGYVPQKPTYDGATEVKDFSTGEIAWKLQNGVDKLYNEETGEYDIVQQIWYQTIGEQTHPGFSGGIVYQYTDCIDGVHYTNDSSIENGLHKFDENGFCVYDSSHYQPAVLNGSTYEISNAGQFYWFAEQVNSGNTSINGRLMNDITVNPGTFDTDGNYTPVAEETVRAWIPIGTESSRFYGAFDGSCKTVSGLYFNDSAAEYVGLFGYTGEIKNSNSTFSYSEVKNIMLVNSYFAGSKYVGGIAGFARGHITNCFNGATVVAASYVGGIVGYNTSEMKFCCNVGMVKCSSGSYFGGVTGKGGAQLTNCYYLDSCVTGATSTSAAKTLEQFKSGEVTYLLNNRNNGSNDIWKQNLGTDTYPSFTGSPVYYDSEITPNYANEKPIKVTISWSGMDFCYSKGTWDTDTMTWQNPGWQHIYGASSGFVMIDNKSSVNIVAEYGATITNEQIVSDNNLAVSFYTSSSFTEDKKLKDNKLTFAPYATWYVYVGMTGDKPSEEFAQTEIGQITVTFSVPDE